MAPHALIIAGYGLNCEEETLLAFERAGGTGKIIHINDIIATPSQLKEYQILAIPGGFSYGDDTGSGNALANRIRHNLWEEMLAFVQGDHLVLGICNGCQVLVNLGIVPAIDQNYGERKIAMLHNASDKYQCRWVDVEIKSSHCIWTKDIEKLHIPVAHAEGNFAMEQETLEDLQQRDLIAMTYITPQGLPANGSFPANPNGSIADSAAFTDTTGRVLAIMPHPERGMFTSQRDDFIQLKDQAQRQGQKLPEFADGMRLFENAINYYK